MQVRKLKLSFNRRVLSEHPLKEEVLGPS
jgi:hypothetical protein